MKVQTNFLLGGEQYVLDLPDGIDPDPELRSVLWYDGAVRYVAYQPFGLEVPPEKNPLLAYAFSVRSKGSLVSVYRALDEPSTRVAYWTLPRGYVSTFYDDRTVCEGETLDTDEGIRQIISGMTLRPGAPNLPALQIESPVFKGDVSDPVQRDEILFHRRDEARVNGSATAATLAVEIWKEPAFVRRGVGAWEEGGWAGWSVTNELSLTVEVKGPAREADRWERDAKSIAGSIVPRD